MLNVDVITLTGPDVLSRISLGQGPERKGEKEEKRMNIMNVECDGQIFNKAVSHVNFAFDTKHTS